MIKIAHIYVLRVGLQANIQTLMSKRLSIFLLSFLIGQLAMTQTPEVLAIRKYVNKNAAPIINEFTGLLALPNVAADPVGQQKSAAFIMEMMNKRGIQNVQLL